MGASTGGPPVLKEILLLLDKSIPVPVVIVQHIAQGFLDGLVLWLAESTGWPVQVARQGERLQPGVVYFAPDHHHLAVKDGLPWLDGATPPEKNLRPAVSYLFRSLADGFGKAAIGVLLTGMGTDGAAELKMMRDKGACTFAQDEESSIIFGMPGEAVKLRAARYVMPPADIARTINQLLLE